jgi:hypothetical protein
MKALRLVLRFSVFMMMFIFIVACTSTKFIVWKDDNYQGRPAKILLVDSFPNPATRKTFQNELVNLLRDRGIDSVVRYVATHDPLLSDKDAITAQAKEAGADTVLITKPVGTRMGIAGTLDMFINTQTDVYDMKSDKLILIATAETQLPEGHASEKQIQIFVKDLVNQLSRSGLF